MATNHPLPRSPSQKSLENSVKRVEQPRIHSPMDVRRLDVNLPPELIRGAITVMVTKRNEGRIPPRKGYLKALAADEWRREKRCFASSE